MRLLTFAHRGEAQTFVRLSTHKTLSGKLSYYQSDDLLFLITGEGVQSTTEQVSAMCGHFYGKITEIMNFGIAGSLSETLQVGNIYPIRTSYGYAESRVQFKSFTSSSSSTIDCITSNNRILSDKDAHTLSCFAQVVDRELWAIASVAQLFNIPFSSYKLISDIAGDQTECFNIKHKAEEYSDKLYDYFAALETPISEEKNEADIELPKAFHVSVSQKRRIIQHLNALSVKEKKSFQELIAEIDTDQIIENEPITKRRTEHFIQALEAKLNPFEASFKHSLSVLVRPLEEIQCKVQFDKHFENDHFQISMRIEHEKHIEKLKQALTELDYAKIKTLLNGEFE